MEIASSRADVNFYNKYLKYPMPQDTAYKRVNIALSNFEGHCVREPEG